MLSDEQVKVLKEHEHTWCIEQPSILTPALVPRNDVEAMCEHCGERRIFKSRPVQLGSSLHIVFEESK